MSPDLWAAKHRTHGPTSGQPGPHDASLTAYTIPFQRALANGGGKYTRVVLVASAQSGKTESVLNILGERFDNKPVPTVYCGPTMDFLTKQLEPRLQELFESAPSLAAKLARGHRNTKLKKYIAGVPLRLAHAGSAVAMKSDPNALAILDEIESYSQNVAAQGSPLELIEARGYSFSDAIVGITSTPTTGIVDVRADPDSGLEFWAPADSADLQSSIWKLWQSGTRHHFCWCCPHCNEYFVVRFSTLRWASAAGAHETLPAEARRSAYIECPRCGGIIEDHHKKELNRSGRFVAPGQSIASDGTVTGEPPDSNTLSFWVSGLCSPFVKFGSRAEAFLTAVRSGDGDRIQTVTNTAFAELYAAGGGDAPAWEQIREHCGEYARGEIPNGSIRLVCTIDVQLDRLYWLIRSWGAHAESWLVNWGELHGLTTEMQVWDDLADFILTPMHGRSINYVLIDSGYRPGKPEELSANRVYDFCRRFPRGVRATKGSSLPLRVPITRSKPEPGIELLRIDSDVFKVWVHDRIRRPDSEPGSWHVPADVTDDYLRQILSEVRVRRASGRIVWVRRSRLNHYLDLEVLQAVAAQFLNITQLRTRVRPQAPPPERQPKPAVVPEEIDDPQDSGQWQREGLGPYGQRAPAMPPIYDDKPSFLYPHGRHRGSFWGRE